MPPPAHDEALPLAEPTSPLAQDEVPDSSSSDGNFDRLVAEHGFGAIHPDGTVGGALASASGEASGAGGHPAHASSPPLSVAMPPDLPADDVVPTLRRGD
eukprot:7279098-Pyramimonas_sp.AAC.1